MSNLWFMEVWSQSNGDSQRNSKSTISREFKRNTQLIRTQWGCWQYKTHYAQTYADERHKNKPKHIKLTKAVKEFIDEKVQYEWSPEQISGYAKRHNLFFISHECIYQYILKNKQQGGHLYKYLRHQSKKYRKRYGSPKRQGPIKNRRFIDIRPAIVDKKERLGDWEIDTIIGKNHKIANNVLTITADNGSEFAYHEKISRELETEFYFAHPYFLWERGLNENTNGLIRQYLKKGCDFSPVTDNVLEFIMDRLNNRPRKALGFATPKEVFYANSR